MDKLSSNYHDWYITGILEEENNILSLLLSFCEHGNIIEKRKLVFENVCCGWNCLLFGWNDIWGIKVQTGIEVSKKVENDVELLGNLRMRKDNNIYKNMIDGLKKKDYYFIEIEGNSGCYGRIVCRNISEVPIVN